MFFGIIFFFFLVMFLLFVFNYKKQPNTLYLLVLFLATMLYSLSHYSISALRNAEVAGFFINHFTPIYLLAGPFLFFYIRNTLMGFKGLKKLDYLHFIPAAIQTIAIAPYALKPFSEKVFFMQQIIENTSMMNEIPFNEFFGTEFNFGIRLLLLVVYIVASGRMLYIFFKKKPTGSYRKTQQWLWLLLGSVSLLVFTYTLFVLNLFSNLNEIYSTTNTVLLTIAAFSFSAIGIIPVFFPHVLYGYSNIQIERKSTRRGLTEVLPTSYYSSMAKNIAFIFNTRKPYLERSYKLETLANELGVPKHQVHLCFKSVFNTTFVAYKTKYKVEWVIEALNHPDFKNDTIDGIGSAAGFNSKGIFYKKFKEFTGHTPKAYKKKFFSH